MTTKFVCQRDPLKTWATCTFTGACQAARSGPSQPYAQPFGQRGVCGAPLTLLETREAFTSVRRRENLSVPAKTHTDTNTTGTVEQGNECVSSV